MAPVVTKRRKIDPQRRTTPVSAISREATTSSVNTASRMQVISSIVHPEIVQAKNFAVAQAQQDGCKANFKVFDSLLGNFLVPVVPTRAELGG